MSKFDGNFSDIFEILGKKLGGGLTPKGKIMKPAHFVFQSYWVVPSTWQSLIENGEIGMYHLCLVFSSPVPELSFLPAPYRGSTRAGERRVQDNLHAHVQSEPIKNYYVPTTPLASMCRTMPFSARAL